MAPRTDSDSDGGDGPRPSPSTESLSVEGLWCIPERDGHHRHCPHRRESSAAATHSDPAENLPPSSSAQTPSELYHADASSNDRDPTVFRGPGEFAWLTPVLEAALRLNDPISRTAATIEVLGFGNSVLQTALDEIDLFSRVAAVAEVLGYESDSDKLLKAMHGGPSVALGTTVYTWLSYDDSDDSDPGAQAPLGS